MSALKDIEQKFLKNLLSNAVLYFNLSINDKDLLISKCQKIEKKIREILGKSAQVFLVCGATDEESYIYLIFSDSINTRALKYIEVMIYENEKVDYVGYVHIVQALRNLSSSIKEEIVSAIKD